ncbi:F-box domain protein [Blumeria hordei DH14]|uniref:F-box domain protein n=1 Tax=Blumeria graminis f. sp. hordei (strain DH14) TaxID=546991 RepID=N1JKX7_BLUG1|nr:F-box domain protein [Blumeria hordei DH14]
MTLLKALDSLRLEDGQPDKVKRRSQCVLSELVTVLSIEEIQHLRARLELRLCSNGNLKFQQLPPEIFLIIANYLDIEDLIQMKIVSRTWNKIFSDKEFCLQMIKKNFPFAINCQTKDFKTDSTREIPIDDPTVWLRHAIINRVRRERGLSSNMMRYDLRWNYPKPKLKYCNGRIAFQKDGIFVVRNLRTQNRSTFTTPDRQTIYSWILSDQYLIGLMHAP